MLGRIYGAVWANFWTPSVWTIAAVAVSHVLHRKSIGRLHDRIAALTHHQADTKES